MKEEKYDLEERLLEYSVAIIRLVDHIPNTRAGNHVAGQLLRSGTSALPNHGEAQAAESPCDFIHKMKICLKELRESYLKTKLKAEIWKTEIETSISEGGVTRRPSIMGLPELAPPLFRMSAL